MNDAFRTIREQIASFKELGYSPREIAFKTGINQTSMWRTMHGQREPTLNDLERLEACGYIIINPMIKQVVKIEARARKHLCAKQQES